MAALGADAEQTSCKANPRHPALIGDSAPNWLLEQCSSLPEWEGSIPTFTQVLAELDKPQPFSLAAWAAGRGTTTAAPPPNSLRDLAAGPNCTQEAMPCAESTAAVGSQRGRQGSAEQPCFQSAEVVATPYDFSQSVESCVGVVRGDPVLQPAAAEAQEAAQQLLSPHKQHLFLRLQRSASASPGKENHGSNGRRGTLFSRNTLAGRLKAAASCGQLSQPPLQHAHSSTRVDAACRGNSVGRDTLLPDPAGDREDALGCASSLPGWLSSGVQCNRRRLNEAAASGEGAMQHASSAPDGHPAYGMGAKRRSKSEPHQSGSGGVAEQCNSATPDEASERGNATSAPAQLASTSDALQCQSVAQCQSVLGGVTGGKAALPPDQDSNSGDERQRSSTSAGVASDAHESRDEHECCSNKTQSQAAHAANPELEATRLRGGSHENAYAAAAGGVESAEWQVPKDNSDAEQNLADGGDDRSGIDQGIVATGFWRKKRQKLGGILELWNRAAQKT